MFKKFLKHLSKLATFSYPRILLLSFPVSFSLVTTHMMPHESLLSLSIRLLIVTLSFSVTLRSIGRLSQTFSKKEKKTTEHDFADISLYSAEAKQEKEENTFNHAQLTFDRTCPYTNQLLLLKEEMDEMISRVHKETVVTTEVNHQLTEVYMATIQQALTSFSKLPTSLREEEFPELEALFLKTKADIQVYLDISEQEAYEQFKYDKRMLQERTQSEY